MKVATKAFIQSPIFKEVLMFGGLFAVALIVSTLIGDHAFATSLINESDNPAAIAGATGGEGSIRDLIQTILNFALGFLGFVATIMVIYGGFLYVTSAGNDDAVGKAKNILLYSIIGIVIILISFALINTVLGAGTGSEDGATTTTTTVQ
ncbi:MAG: hypothetical protein AAB802_02505 [Patescibacteria group bacterium]